MIRKQVKIIFLVVLMCGLCQVYGYDANDFATELVSYSGSFGSSPYDDPCTVLGRASSEVSSMYYFEPIKCSLAYPAAKRDPNNEKLVVTLVKDAQITVKFNHKVADDPGNPYGIDFLVFGNSFFSNGSYIQPGTNMEMVYIQGNIVSDPVVVSVSQDGENWFTFDEGPFADSKFPTNPFEWDDVNDCWSRQLDWTRPVDPNLSASDFADLSVPEAIELYEGSAGGTGFDLQDLGGNSYQQLEADPCTGRKWIQYVSVRNLYEDPNYFGEVDAFSDVSGCGDYKHPYPIGDATEDCVVNSKDLKKLREYWCAQVYGPEDPADDVDFCDDQYINYRDVVILIKNWGKCSWECGD